MPVIINEFEVVAPEAPQRPVLRPPAPEQPKALSPRDVAEIIRQRAERLARLEAH